MSGVAPEQRFSGSRPCPICGGSPSKPSGRGERCYGFVSEDGQWAHCTREERAGGLEPNGNSGTYAHRLAGECRCGEVHDPLGAPVVDLRDRRARADARSQDTKAKPKGRGRLVRTFEVKGPDGELVALHERYEDGGGDKSYAWRRRAGGPAGLEGLRLKDLPLYGSERVADWPRGAAVVLAEGEPAAEALHQAGIRALGTVCGAQSVPGPEALGVLGDRPVILWPDTDEEGLKHMRRIAGLLEGVTAAVRWYEWPDAPEVRTPDGKLKAQDAADHPAVRSRDPRGLRSLRKELARAPKWKTVDAGGDGGSSQLPVIQVNNRHLRDVTSDALGALAERNDPPEVFVRSGALVRVREDENHVPEIQAMDENHLRGRLARVADFVRLTEKGETKVSPPEVVVKDVKALEGWGLPALEAVVESPILRPDGTIFDTPGYDPQTRLAYRPARGFEPPTIPAEPTKDDLRQAVELIDEAVGEFPYEDGASAANTLGLMLTPLVRQAIDGPVPMALIDKPQAGTGGSLLAEAVAIIGTGREAEMLGAPREDEEWRKQITAKLSSGATMITVDNVEHPLYAPSLARALTARTWTDRVLGRSESITLAQRATWLATGNNIILRGDLPRRCYWVRLDAKKARPWKRGGFKHPDLLRWVSENRGALVGALLTIARAWFAAGKPKADGVPRLGSFESWAEIVGGMVEFAGIPGFLGNLEALYEKADEAGAEWEEFLSAWSKSCGESPVTVAELVEKIKMDDELRGAVPPDLAEVLDKGQGSFSRRLGKALSSRAGTRYGEDELHVVKAGEKKRAVKWSVQRGALEGEFTSLVSLYDPNAAKNHAYNSNQEGKKRSVGPETNSRNSQTHPSPEEEGFGLPVSDPDLEDLRGLFEADDGEEV